MDILVFPRIHPIVVVKYDYRVPLLATIRQYSWQDFSTMIKLAGLLNKEARKGKMILKHNQDANTSANAKDNMPDTAISENTAAPAFCAKTADASDFVFFWKLEEENEEFTNFYPCRIYIEGIRYNCVEQYMMSRKALLFGDTEIYSKIMESEDPDEIKAYGRQIQHMGQMQMGDRLQRELCKI